MVVRLRCELESRISVQGSIGETSHIHNCKTKPRWRTVYLSGSFIFLTIVLVHALFLSHLIVFEQIRIIAQLTTGGTAARLRRYFDHMNETSLQRPITEHHKLCRTEFKLRQCRWVFSVKRNWRSKVLVSFGEDELKWMIAAPFYQILRAQAPESPHWIWIRKSLSRACLILLAWRRAHCPQGKEHEWVSIR